MTREFLYTATWLLIFILNFQNGIGQNNIYPYQDPKLPIEDRINDLLPRLNTVEKVAQMRIFHERDGIFLTNEGTLNLSEKTQLNLKNGICGIKNPGEHLSPRDAALLTNQLQSYIINQSKWGIPALFITEAYNGVDAHGCTRLARPINQAATWNTTLVNAAWDLIGREARGRGMHMCHSPEADLVRDPRFGRMSEAFGEDTYLTTQMVVAAVKGVQGNNKGLSERTHIGAVTKHFAAYGQVQGGTNFASIEISPRTLIDEIYPPFEAAVKEAHTLGIMASHGDINGIPSHGNRQLLTETLKQEWGFDGYVVSDANDIARLYFFMKAAESPEDAVIMGLSAGMDVDLYSEDAYALLPQLVASNPTLLPMIDEAVRRVLRTKFRLGLFDRPYIDINNTNNIVRSQANLDCAKKLDEESIILLKNEDNFLPLDINSPLKVAVLGPLADSNLIEALYQRHPKAKIVFDKGFELTDKNRSVPKLIPTDEDIIERMLSKAKDQDVILLCIGGDEFTAKEAFFNNALGDRADIDPVGSQDALLLKLQELQIPIVVLLSHRRTLSINVANNHATAILDLWDLGEHSCTTIADVLFGNVNPSGKLPVTVPRTIGQLPFHYSVKPINHRKEYLFMDQGPLYPFGFGLSYADFDFSAPSLSLDTMYLDDTLQAAITVTNTSTIEGKEVVQLYIKDEIGSTLRPDKELRRFSKILIEPGDRKVVSFQITANDLKFTGRNMESINETGDYTIMIGNSSVHNKPIPFRFINTNRP